VNTSNPRANSVISLNDRVRLDQMPDKIGRLRLSAIAVMHGPVISRHFEELLLNTLAA
jgi:hypothetical protein